MYVKNIGEFGVGNGLLMVIVMRGLPLKPKRVCRVQPGINGLTMRFNHHSG
jgi:hypothetical protein